MQRFSRVTQTQHHEMITLSLRQPLCSFAPPPLPGTPSEPDRVAGPQHVPPALAVSGPKLGAQQGAQKRTRNHPSHDYRALIIEPHEVRRPLPHALAHKAVVAIDDPGFGSDCLGHAANGPMDAGALVLALL